MRLDVGPIEATITCVFETAVNVSQQVTKAINSSLMEKKLYRLIKSLQAVIKSSILVFHLLTMHELGLG